METEGEDQVRIQIGFLGTYCPKKEKKSYLYELHVGLVFKESLAKRFGSCEVVVLGSNLITAHSNAINPSHS